MFWAIFKNICDYICIIVGVFLFFFWSLLTQPQDECAVWQSSVENVVQLNFYSRTQLLWSQEKEKKMSSKKLPACSRFYVILQKITLLHNHSRPYSSVFFRCKSLRGGYHIIPGKSPLLKMFPNPQWHTFAFCSAAPVMLKQHRAIWGALVSPSVTEYGEITSQQELHKACMHFQVTARTDISNRGNLRNAIICFAIDRLWW